jgi:spore coat polysaccharide biosynthesis protein SpsF (cytidylyltransferase family)
VRIGAIVQARMGSARLPGKVLLELAGRPALGYVLERLDQADTLQAVIVASSRERADDAVAEYCAANRVACHRGAEADVAARLLEAAERFELDAFVRVNGDSPLLDQALVDRGTRLFQRGGRDLVTNVSPRSFPRGQSVEVISTEALRAALPRLTAPEDREHVTAGLYRDSDGLAIENFDAGADGVGPDGGDVRLVLDTADDAARIELILRGMARPHWRYRWQEVLELARAQTAMR